MLANNNLYFIRVAHAVNNTTFHIATRVRQIVHTPVTINSIYYIAIIVTIGRIIVSYRKGNGILKYIVSIDKKGKITRYSLSYINFNIYTGDNGRVLGYDNCHGYHHRHYMGNENAIEFLSFEDIKDRFEKEWEVLHEKIKRQKNR